MRRCGTFKSSGIGSKDAVDRCRDCGHSRLAHLAINNVETPSVREFDTGATRDSDHNKPDYEGFLSPLVLHAYGVHMKRHMIQPDGKRRDSDNWQKGIPMDAYMKSMWRHFFDVWTNHRKDRVAVESLKSIRKERIITAICALLFNVMGYLHEYIKANPEALAAFEKEA